MRRSFTLIEVLIATAVTAVIALVSASALLPLQRTSTSTMLNVDVDDTSRRVLLELRKDLRQSGSQTGLDQVTSPATPTLGDTTGSVLTFKKRVTLGSDPDADWSQPITYQLVPDGSFSGVAGNPARFRLVRREGTTSVTIARNLASLQFTRSPGDDSVLVEFEVLRNDPRWTDGNPPPPVRRRYRDRITVWNR